MCFVGFKSGIVVATLPFAVDYSMPFIGERAKRARHYQV